jgi:hypothetical protein
MRYLVIAEPTGAAPNVLPQQLAQMLDSVVLPSLEMLAKWEREGRIRGGSYAGRRGGIIDAASNEELADLLMTLPFWASKTGQSRPSPWTRQRRSVSES